jgi:hypothetical protein
LSLFQNPVGAQTLFAPEQSHLFKTKIFEQMRVKPLNIHHALRMKMKRKKLKM